MLRDELAWILCTNRAEINIKKLIKVEEEKRTSKEEAIEIDLIKLGVVESLER